MLVSYKWLQEYVDVTGVSAEELAEKITKSGIEVEGVETLNEGLSGVVVGHVLECEKHPKTEQNTRRPWDGRTSANHLWCT
jgi:phenylalanyl-tRNA synthetase beta chain